MYRWLTFLRHATRKVWFRATMFTLAGIGVALAAWAVSALFPGGIGIDIGQDSVSTILQILASSMLAVTTFSLTTMVSAYGAASTSGTPRSTQLLILDRTSQNALSTFIGAFAYSIVGIVVLSTNILSAAGIALLYVGTLAVVAIILVALLSWVSFLTTFGRVADIMDRVEKAASSAMKSYAKSPRAGAAPWREVPSEARAVLAGRDGYVTDLHMGDLGGVAEVGDLDIWVAVRPGATVAEGEVLAHVVGEKSHEVDGFVRGCFAIAAHRTFDSDPRLGLIALSEVASKALSPGINDPGTAVGTLRAIERVLRIAQTTEQNPEVTRPRIRMQEIDPTDFITDGLRPTARDGAGLVEVSVRLQREIARLMDHAPDEAWVHALRAESAEAFARSEAVMTLKTDVDAVRTAREVALARRGASQ